VRGHATHTDSKVLNSEMKCSADNALEIEKGVFHKPHLLAHSILSSSNVGNSKLQATVESDKGFYFIPEVVMMGVTGDTKCKSPSLNGIQ